MRRLSTIVATAAVAALALTGCSSSDAPNESPAASSSSDAAFPVTIPTKFEDVTIDEAPTRIVALGWGDAETALALGVQPVGASDWLAFGGDGVGPWAEGLYDESPEIISTLEPEYEAIAALEPDLILDTKSSGDQERYDRLSSIATTVGVPEDGENYLTTSSEQLEMIGAALGVPEKADELSAELDDAFASAAEAHPEWDGLTATAATRTSEGWGAYVEASSRVQFLEQLGFKQTPAIADIEPNALGFSVDVSSEQLDVFDADLIVAFPIYIDKSEITDDAQWQAIPAVAEGHALVLDGDLSSAYSLGSTLSTQYAIDSLVPMIEDALG